MSNEDLHPNADFSASQLQRVVWLILGLMLWVSAGFIFQYKRHWLGNKQEMFPSPLMPGFKRNKVISDSSYYVRYEIHVIRHTDTLKMLPTEFFKDQGLFRTQQIFKNKNDDWEPEIWSKDPTVEKVCFVKDLKQFVLLDKGEEHFLINRTEVCYDRK